MWQRINLYLAVLWLLAGVGLLVYKPDIGKGPTHWLGTDPIPWVCLALAVYNSFRWWGGYMVRRAQRQIEAEQAARLRQRQTRDRPPPDPTFDFSDPAPRAP
jgi:hypothetical protein